MGPLYKIYILSWSLFVTHKYDTDKHFTDNSEYAANANLFGMTSMQGIITYSSC